MIALGLHTALRGLDMDRIVVGLRGLVQLRLLRLGALRLRLYGQLDLHQILTACAAAK